MRKNLKKFSKIILNVIFWVFAIFFFLGAIVYISQSLLLAVVLLLLGLFFLPPVWKMLSRRGVDKRPLRTVRSIGAGALFILAVAITPTPEPEVVQVQNVTDAVAVEKEPASKNELQGQTKDNAQKLVSIVSENSKYIVKGTGLADTDYVLKFSDSPNFTVRTNSEGFFSEEAPASTQMFGRVELTRDVNGGWFGGKETYDTRYFTLTSPRPVLSETLPEPVILGVGGSSSYDMSGYYVPGATLLLKAGDSLLASAKVDKSGRYQFVNIKPGANYAEIALYEKVSTGWFSSKEESRISKRFLDIEKRTVLVELPVIVKEVVSTEAISFTSRNVESKSVEKGKTNVTQEGANGEKKLVYKVTYRGNDEISRELLRADVSKQPVEKITTVGTYEYVAPVQQKTYSSSSSPSPAPSSSPGAYYKNCTAARAAGVAPLYSGDPGYRPALDRNNNGVACED